MLLYVLIGKHFSHVTVELNNPHHYLCSHITQVCVACSLNVSPSHPVFWEEETMEALTAEYEEEVEEEEEESAEAAESEAAFDEHQWSGEEPELDSPQAEPLEQAEAIDEAQDVDLEPAEAASATACSSMDREVEAEGEEGPETGVSCPLLSQSACYCIVTV